MSEFQERYKLYDNLDLLRILEESISYEPDAIEAAKLELANREVSEEEIQEVRGEILEKRSKTSKRQDQISQVKSKSTEFIQSISPIQTEAPTVDRKINLIALSFGCISIYQIFKEFDMIPFMLSEFFSTWDLSMIFYFFPLILLPLSVFLFWRRRKAGWVLLSVFLIYSLINSIVAFFLTWDLNRKEDSSEINSNGFGQLFDELENLFPQQVQLNTL